MADVMTIEGTLSSSWCFQWFPNLYKRDQFPANIKIVIFVSLNENPEIFLETSSFNFYPMHRNFQSM